MIAQVVLTALLSLTAVMLTAGPLHAHSGGLDIHGCHHDHINGGYHCHRGPLAEKSFGRNRRCWLLRKHLTMSKMIIRNGCNLLTHLRRHLKRIRYCGPRSNERFGAKLVPKHPDTP